MAETNTQSVPVSRHVLCTLVENGKLSASAWEEALFYLGFRPGMQEWGDFWKNILLLCGGLLLFAGLIFFVAWNWSEMHRFAKLALVEGAVVATALLAIFKGLENVSGRTALLLCGISVGPMLAVFGQTYQTGADLWELFRAWTVILFLFALVGRQAVLWLVTWIVGSLFAMSYLGRTLNHPIDTFALFVLIPEYLLASALGLSIWEGAAYYTRSNSQQSWLRVRWLPRVFFFALMTNLVLVLFPSIISNIQIFEGDVLYLRGQFVYWPLYLFSLIAGWIWYRYRRPDLFMLACMFGSIACLLVALLIRSGLHLKLEVFDSFIWGVIIIGLTLAVGKILFVLQRKMEQEFGADKISAEEASDFSEPGNNYKQNWSKLWAHLRSQNLISEEEISLSRSPDLVPWYIQAMLAFGGWIAAIFFLFSLGLLLNVTLRVSDKDSALLLGSLVLLVIAWISLRYKTFFAQNFGFAAAMAGAGGFGLALVFMNDPTLHWPFYAALPFLLTFLLMPNTAYRFLASMFITTLLPLWFFNLIFKRIKWYSYNLSFSEVSDSMLYLYIIVSVIWWSGISIAIAKIWLQEGLWRFKSDTSGSKNKLYNMINLYKPEMLIPLAFGSYIGLMAFTILQFSYRYYSKYEIQSVSLNTVGLGAAVGLVYLVWVLTKFLTKKTQLLILLCLSITLLPVGWYLPGVGVSLFGMTLSRYLNNSIILVISGVFLFVYIIYYYYYLGVSLLHKSLTMMATGMLLLAIAIGIKIFMRRLGYEKHSRQTSFEKIEHA